MSIKNPVTPSGIEPATFRFLVQCRVSGEVSKSTVKHVDSKDCTLRSLRGTCVADGTHQTPCSHHRHLSVPLWHQGLNPRVEEIGVKWLDTGGDGLLHLGTCCMFLAIQLLLVDSKEMVITVPHIANCNFEWLWGYGRNWISGSLR
jgi:hypothetical protein